MHWLIKKTFKITLLAFVIILLIMAAVILFVDPNNFKKEIQEFAHSFTGYDMEISGPIQWTFKPELAMLLKDISIPNPETPDSPLMQAKEANVFLDAYSLISGKLIVNKLNIKDLTTNLWPSNTKTEKDRPLRSLVVKDLILQNANLTLKNEQLSINWTLTSARIVAKNIELNPLTRLEPISIKGELTNLDNQVSIKIDTTIDTDLEKHSLTLKPLLVTWNHIDLKGNAVITQFSNNPIISGEMTLDPLDITALNTNIDTETSKTIYGSADYKYTAEDKTLSLSKLSMQIDNGTLNGNFDMSFTSPYKVNFDLNAGKLNLLSVAKMFGTIFPSLRSTNNNLLPIELLKNTSLVGKLSATDVNLGQDFIADHLTGNIATQDSVLNIKPITLNAYKGSHSGDLSIDYSKDTPTFKINQQANDLALEPLLKLLNLPNTIMGTGETKIAIQASGKNFANLKQSATGSIVLTVKDGTVFGIDLDMVLQYMVKNISDLNNESFLNANSELGNLVKTKLSDWMSTQKNNPTTAFKKLEFKADLKQGGGGSNLSMVSPTYELNGTGNFDLIDTKINYNTQVINKNTESNISENLANYLKQIPLSMAISGTIAKLIFIPDLQDYAMSTIKKAQSDSTKKVVDKMVDATGANMKTNKNAEQIFVDGLKGVIN